MKNFQQRQQSHAIEEMNFGFTSFLFLVIGQMFLYNADWRIAVGVALTLLPILYRFDVIRNFWSDTLPWLKD